MEPQGALGLSGQAEELGHLTEGSWERKSCILPRKAGATAMSEADIDSIKILGQDSELGLACTDPHKRGSHRHIKAAYVSLFPFAQELHGPSVSSLTLCHCRILLWVI